MKRIIVIFFLLGSFLTQSQLLPRFGISPDQDNTGRIITYGYNYSNPATANAVYDTVKLHPGFWETIVQPQSTVTDTITYVIPYGGINYTGDILIFKGISSVISSMLRFRSGVYGVSEPFKFITAADSNILLKKTTAYYIQFEYNGTFWMETVKDTLHK